MPPTLIVEDGTGLSTANTYVDVTYVETYLANTGRDVDWLLLTSDQKTILVYRSATFIEDLYRGKWKGYITNSVEPRQNLSFPRRYLYDEEDVLVPYNVVPNRIKEAQCEACLLFVNNLADPDTVLYPEVDPEGQLRRVSIGQEEVLKEFFKNNNFSEETRFLTLEKKVLPYLKIAPNSKWGCVPKVRG